nr:MAG TPA: hypothetical protein [Caudoviricetes sp.]
MFLIFFCYKSTSQIDYNLLKKIKQHLGLVSYSLFYRCRLVV